MSIFSKLNFKDQAFRLREDAILDATSNVLAAKGFDLMTMDDVANLIGISKPSLYKHFKSKEDLVGAAMIRLLDGATTQLESFPSEYSAKEKLSALLEWALRVRLDGGLPFLPSTSNAVREMLMRNLKYVGRVIKLNSQLEKLVVAAQKNGDLSSKLSSDVILFSYYARSCDPAVDYLQRFSKMDSNAIVENMLRVCFQGLED
ncbi:helix-turn-helix transcriptional regulator [Undibacterium seohonense]|jgi:AcrR family transcriptional regulator|uniref:Helix-turn-helix transcriptional regulator n=1 Tax=Undibacterium seohonense TaxID=1344950 RepID=A0ABR6X0H0_9BURK|nr:TetR/AcrR family transcriptional regulator [Undibacterium seohonense]MBC3806065.1 helix-turn-helix transcriptional regulator [Undibacterium seohonense]